MEAASINWSNDEPLTSAALETNEAKDEKDEITLLDGIHEGAFAHRFAINGIDTGMAVTRLCINPKDQEWTYYFHFDNFEGKYFGEADVQSSGKLAYYYGEAIGEGITGQRSEQAERLMIATMILLPLAIKKDFPETEIIEDDAGYQYDLDGKILKTPEDQDREEEERKAQAR